MRSRANYIMKNSPCQLYAWHLKIGSLSSQSRKFQVTKIYVLWLVLWSWLRRITLRKRLLDSSFGFHYLKQTTGAWKSWRSFWENPYRNHVVLGYASINKTFLHISLSQSSKHFLKWAACSISNQQKPTKSYASAFGFIHFFFGFHLIKMS